MADISKVTLPNDASYDIKDAKAVHSVNVTQTTISSKTTKEIAKIGVDGTDTSIYADDAEAIIKNVFADHTIEGNPITFDAFTGLEVVKSAELTLNPIQDLHGYDYPWAGGAGKNLLATPNGVDFTIANVRFYCNNGFYMSGTSNANISSTNSYFKDNFAFTLPAGTYRMTRRADVVYSMYLNKYDDDSQICANTATFTLSESTKVYYCIYMASGRTVSGLQENQIEVGSTSTAFAPYENICPISGRTEVNVQRNGVNQWDEEWESGTISTSNGQPSPSSLYIRSKNFCLCEPNKSYYITHGAHQAVVYWYDENEEFLSYDASGSTESGKVVTSHANAKYFKVRYGDSAGVQTYDNSISLNYPSTDMAYHTYQGHTYTSTFGQTVYGGEVDVTSGETTNKMAIVDLADLNWTMSTLDRWNTTYFRNLIKKPSELTVKADIVAEQYKTVSSNDLLGDTTLIGIECNIYGDVKVRNGSTTETPKGKIAYELAAPTTIETSAEEIELLKGQNVLWTDGDNIKLVYSADIKAYIDKKLEELS